MCERGVEEEGWMLPAAGEQCINREMQVTRSDALRYCIMHGNESAAPKIKTLNPKP